jgi:hypothetical protein
MKLTKRKGFNFFRSYYDVYNELENDADKVAFIDALLDRQFLGIKPNNLKGMAKFAYISQTNSIDSQVKGYEDKTKTKLTPTEPPCYGGKVPPTEQVEEKEKEKEETTTKEIKVVDEIDVSINLLNNQKNTEDFLKEIATENHQMWVENLYMKFKLKKGSIGKLLKDFNTHLGIQEKTPKTLKDYKEHFYNWLNTQERVGKLGDYSNKKVGAL